jgi:hypothetical protein
LLLGVLLLVVLLLLLLCSSRSRRRDGAAITFEFRFVLLKALEDLAGVRLVSRRTHSICGFTAVLYGFLREASGLNQRSLVFLSKTKKSKVRKFVGPLLRWIPQNKTPALAFIVQVE